MAFDAQRAATGVADLVDDATKGLATEASLQAGLLEVRAEIARLEGKLEASVAELRADLYRALWLQGAAIVGAVAAVMTIVRLVG